ncbi:MAG TPA: Na+-dependent transporter [Devosiaceae bacterium]|jgi:BASS family bile acid:Na+ symporter|nr:Na+-dependent transporter [Devosiaceae bacterium]
MSLAQLIPLLLNISMGIFVLGLGLHTTLDDEAYLLRRPGLLLRSIFSMNIAMPVVATAIALLADLDPAIKIAIVALALSPVPPILPSTQTKAGGTAAYTMSLLTVAALLSIVIVPVGMLLLGLIFGLNEAVPAARIVPVVLTTILAPLAVGIAIRYLAPDFARNAARTVSLIGVILLLVALVPVLATQWPQLLSMVGNDTLLVLALFTITGITIGHFLGGPDPDDQSVLGLATGTRHPGVALAIATTAFPEQTAVLAVVLWHLIIGALVSLPYVRWRQRVHTQPTHRHP